MACKPQQELPSVAGTSESAPQLETALRELANERGARLSRLSAINYADGSHSHVALRYKEPGRLSQYLAISASGLEPLSAAQERFKEAHELAHGKLAMSSAIKLVDKGFNTFEEQAVAWFSRQYVSELGLLEQIRELEPQAEVTFGRRAPFAVVSGLSEAESVQALAKLSGVTRVDVEDRTPSVTAFGVPQTPGWQIPNNAFTTNAHQVFNAWGHRGSGQKIGSIAIVGLYPGGDDVLFISESLHDTKEIIHVKAPRDYTSIRLLYILPGTIESCDDGVSGPDPDRFYVKVVTWP